MKMRCPHCNSWAFTRSSIEITDTSRESFWICKNFECGHTFSAVTTINRTLSPSAVPNPRVIIPMSSHMRRGVLSQQLTSMPTSDYTPTQIQPSTADLFDSDPRPG